MLKKVGTTAGVVLAIIGLGGFEDDVRGWIDKLTWVDDSYRWILLVAGLVLIVWINFPSNWRAWIARGVPSRLSAALGNDPALLSMVLSDASPAYEFYSDRHALEKTAHTIREEFKTGADIWAAWFAGSFVSAQELLSEPNGLKRLILAHPDGTQIEQLAASFKRPLEILRGDIRNLTEQAEREGILVRWYDGPLVPMVIGNPLAGDGWVRFEIPIYYSAERPNLVVHESQEPKLIERVRQTFEDMWSVAELPMVAKERIRVETRERMTQELETVERDGKADWADSLIRREQERPARYLSVQTILTRRSHLDDAEPYFDIEMHIDYRGPLRLIVCEAFGHLQWDGTEFASEPRVVHSDNTPLPFVGDGPITAYVRLRQYVGGRKDEIKAFLARGAADMDFSAGGFTLNVRIETFEGTRVYDAPVYGSYIRASIPR